MSLIRKWWSAFIILAAVSVLFSFSIISAFNIDKENKDILEPFYGVSSKLTAELERIAFADDEVQAMVKNREYVLHVSGETIEVKDYNLAVGVYIKSNTTPAEFRTWIKNGRQDSSIIDKYVGALSIGYNNEYFITIDKTANSVESIDMIKNTGDTIPEVTGEDMQAALDIASNDSTVQSILKDKSYRLIPNGQIGAWLVTPY